MLETIANFLYAGVRIATPFIFISICSTITLQAGLLNMAAESMMLTAALTGTYVSFLVQNVWLGILAGSLSSVLIILALMGATYKMKVDLYLMSISLNMALTGGTVFCIFLITGSKTSTPAGLAFGNISVGFIEKIPFIGKVLSGHNAFTYIGLIMTVIVWFLLFKTKLGLRIRAVGQNPQAAESVGINPRVVSTIAFLIAGFVGSFGGMYLSMGYQNFFLRDMVGGRGFTGLAAASVANAQPFGSMVISFLFGFAYNINNMLKTVVQDQYALLALPYLFIIVLYFVLSAYRKSQFERLQRANRRKLEALQAAEHAAVAAE